MELFCKICGKSKMTRIKENELVGWLENHYRDDIWVRDINRIEIVSHSLVKNFPCSGREIPSFLVRALLCVRPMSRYKLWVGYKCLVGCSVCNLNLLPISANHMIKDICSLVWMLVTRVCVHVMCMWVNVRVWRRLWGCMFAWMRVWLLVGVWDEGLCECLCMGACWSFRRYNIACSGNA